MQSLATCLNPRWELLASEGRGIPLPSLMSFLVVQTPQRVSLALDRRLDGKLKLTSDIRLRTASSSRRWRLRQEMEIRKRVGHASHAVVRWTPDPLHPSG